MRPDVDEWPGRTEAIMPHVSRALGDGIDKLVDANSGFSVARAIAVGRMLQDQRHRPLRGACALLGPRRRPAR